MKQLKNATSNLSCKEEVDIEKSMPTSGPSWTSLGRQGMCGKAHVPRPHRMLLEGTPDVLHGPQGNVVEGRLAIKVR